MTSSMRKISLLLLAFALVVLINGCSSKDHPGTSNPSSASNPNHLTYSDILPSTFPDENGPVEESPSSTYVSEESIKVKVGEPDSGLLSETQRNSINMLNYITVLTQEINDSKGSRLYLESAYSSLINNTYPNAVDTRTQAQLSSILDSLENYRMISVKRERLEYLFEQAQAQLMRQAIPNPMSVLNVVQSKNLLKNAISVLYLAVDSVSSYNAASAQNDLQYLKDGWELDDAEAAELHNSRKNAFSYMISMVRDNALPGDYALNEESVKEFVSWKNNTNPVRKMAWLESNQNTYKQYGPYWLELAKDYYDAEDYIDCLQSIYRYESVATRIYRKDYNYAETLPMAIMAAKEIMSPDEYVSVADRYATAIIENTDNANWTLRYLVAQVYLDLFANTKNPEYLDKAFQITFENINILVDEQKRANKAYLEDVQLIEAGKDANKREKEEVKQYNNLLKATRKTELPPVNEALYLNCDLLFALAVRRGISAMEQKRVDSILHENGERIFLTETLDNMFWFGKEAPILQQDNIEVEFDGKEFIAPVSCVTNRSKIRIVVKSASGTETFEDVSVKEVEREKETDCSRFKVSFTSETLKKQKFQEGDTVTITVMPVVESPEKLYVFSFEAKAVKKLGVINSIGFERK